MEKEFENKGMAKKQDLISAEGLFSLLGESIDSDAIAKLLVEFKIDRKKVKIPRDESAVYYDLGKTGITITITTGEIANIDADAKLFKDESIFILSGVAVQLQGSKLVKITYTGELPFKLSKSDAREQVRKKLGKPQVKEDGKDPLDMWQEKKRDVMINYTPDLKSIRSVGVCLPMRSGY